MMEICMVQGATSPLREFTLLDGAGAPVQIGLGSVMVRITGLDRAYRSERAAVVVNPSEGRVRYDPAPEDTAEAGLNRLEFAVTYDDSGVEVFPVEGPIWLEVRPAA
ncbi:hypothetical protein ACGYK5_17050 [Sulfitobacter sp. 1A16787]|uniref:hypothetical protein n=1 Tax=Sulfitobacter sp. 1A16787 TaxID=3368571 RepID=UPI00374775FE